MHTEPISVDPVDTCFSCDGTPHIACHECKVLHCTLHVSILCQLEICVGLRQFWTANVATVVVASAIVATSAVNTFPGVWICRKWYAVPPQYPQNAYGQMRNDQAFCTELQGELKTALFGMCTNNPTTRGKPRHADTTADLIFKRVFCNYLYRCWPWPCQDSFLEPDFVSSARSQFYFVMLAECQLMGA